MILQSAHTVWLGVPRDDGVQNCLKWISFAELTSRFRFTELTFGRMSTLTKRFGASTSQEVFTRRSIEFLRLAPASGISLSRQTSTSWSWL